ncbi:MAG: hypothetical protein AAF708_21390 [Deinococcota bacterium]
MPKQGLNKLERVCYVLGHLIFGLDGVPVDHRLWSLQSRSFQASSTQHLDVARDSAQKHHLRHHSHRGTAQ